MRLSVIIPAYNEEQMLPRLLHALRAQLHKGDEIIVVDNNSTDKTYAVARRLAKVYRCKEQGISPARNYGAKRARGEVLAFLDADVLPGPQWRNVIEEDLADKRISALTGLNLYELKSPVKQFIVNFLFYLMFLYVKTLNWFGVVLVQAPNIIVRKKVFDKTKGFEKVICEDIYFSKILQKMDVRGKGDRRLGVQCSGRRLESKGLLSVASLLIRSFFVKVSADKYAKHDSL